MQKNKQGILFYHVGEQIAACRVEITELIEDIAIAKNDFGIHFAKRIEGFDYIYRRIDQSFNEKNLFEIIADWNSRRDLPKDLTLIRLGLEPTGPLAYEK